MSAACREFKLIYLSWVSYSTSYCHTYSDPPGKDVFGVRAIHAVGWRDSDEGIGAETALVRSFSEDEARPAHHPCVPRTFPSARRRGASMRLKEASLSWKTLLSLSWSFLMPSRSSGDVLINKSEAEGSGASGMLMGFFRVSLCGSELHFQTCL